MQNLTHDLTNVYNIIFNQSDELWASLILSPPGSGKTSFIIDFFKNMESPKNIVLLAPLRAIVSELGIRFKHEKNVEIILKSHHDAGDSGHDKVLKRLKNGDKLFMVTTPESLGADFLNHFDNKETIFIFDEIHLFHYWGEDFRPYLDYFFMEIVTREFGIIALTATFETKYLENFLEHLKNNYDKILYFNFGNQRLLNLPKRISDFSLFGQNFFRRFLIRKILYHSGQNLKEETSLVFCRTRIEVKRWQEFFERRGMAVLGCVGGEVNIFQSELNKMREQNKTPEVIVSTIALSHGVNLPPIRNVFIGYKILNNDFYIQMVGRGGRDGKGYQLYLFNAYQKNWKYFFNAFIEITQIFCGIFKFSNRFKPSIET